MKKKHIILGASLLSALVAGLCPFIAEAKTEDVNNDTFVFNANAYNVGKTFEKNKNVINANNVTLKMGSVKGTIKEVSFSNDSAFSKALYSASTTNPIYTISASKGTKVGVYYSLADKNGKAKDDNTLSASYTSTIWWDIFHLFSETKTEAVDYEEKANNVFYSEFTLSSTDIKLNTSSQYLYLYGVTVVSSEEINNRNEANTAIEDVLNYVSSNGVTTSDEFKALVEAANDSVAKASHVSNYDEYLEVLNQYNELEALSKASESVNELISNLADVEYTEDYKNLLANIENELNNLSSTEFVSNYETFVEKKNAFNTLSENARNAFEEKVNEANAVKGETSSYVLINEAEALYNELIESDKVLVAESANTLNEVKNAYTEMEAAVTDNTFAFTYNEDGSVNKIIFVGTINDFTTTSDIDKLVIYYINELTGEKTEVQLHTVYTSLKVAGNMVKARAEAVRYICTYILNDDNQYSGNVFSMYYEVIYKDGYVIKSNLTSVEVK